MDIYLILEGKTKNSARLQPIRLEAFQKFHHISLINKNQAFVLDYE